MVTTLWLKQPTYFCSVHHIQCLQWHKQSQSYIQLFISPTFYIVSFLVDLDSVRMMMDAVISQNLGQG